jgi:hypothetical protein
LTGERFSLPSFDNLGHIFLIIIYSFGVGLDVFYERNLEVIGTICLSFGINYQYDICAVVTQLCLSEYRHNPDINTDKMEKCKATEQ